MGRLKGRSRIAAAAAGLLFVALTVAGLATQGLELSNDVLFLWVVLGLLAVSLTDIRRWTRGVVVDWLPFAGFLIAYDFARGAADSLGIAPHTGTGIDFDRALFGSTLPTNWLQDRLFDPAVAHWYDYAVFFVYLSHFFATLLIAAVLWRVAYPRFRRFRTMVLSLAGVGFLTYALFPATPPWLAAQDGQLPATYRTIGYMWGHLGIYPASSLFENGSGLVNDVAAVPSLHAAYPVLVMLFFWRGRRGWQRALLAAYPLAMAFALVYAGEHYVFDIVLGWVYGAAVYAAVLLVERARAGRRAAEASPIALPDSRARA